MTCNSERPTPMAIPSVREKKMVDSRMIDMSASSGQARRRRKKVMSCGHSSIRDQATTLMSDERTGFCDTLAKVPPWMELLK